MPVLAVTCEDISKIRELATLGVDDVILALDNSAFSALRSFSVAKLAVAIEEAKKNGMTCTILMNGLFSQQDIFHTQEILNELIEDGADYITISDFGCLQFAKEDDCMNQIIYDPTTLMTSSYEAEICKKLGIGYCTISPVLTKEEIEKIAGVMPTSMIIHGHLLMSVSKRKLLSEYKDAYKKDVEEEHTYYLQEEKRSGHMPIYENNVGTMIYTDFIQESFQEINDFVDKGLDRLEIHTEFLEWDMVVDTIKAYRDILDGKDAKEIEESYKAKYGMHPLANGYYGEKTIK